MKGYLKKKNRWGFKQSRYFEHDASTSELKWYKDENMNPLKSSIRVEEADLVNRFGDFLVTGQSRDLRLKADTILLAEKWCKALNTRAEVVVSLPSAAAVKAVGGAPDAKAELGAESASRNERKEGWLQFPSPSRFARWQNRFVRLRNGSLLYYKTESSIETDYEGEIVLDQTTTANVSDAGGNKGVLISTSLRTIELQAPTSDAAEDWVLSIRMLLARRDALTAAALASGDGSELDMLTEQRNHTPKWIVRWDAESDAEHLLRIQSELDGHFGPAGVPKNVPEGSTPLQFTLAAATSIIEELDDKARECMPRAASGEEGGEATLTEAGREPRPDIFETILRYYHFRLVNELGEFLTDQTYEAFTVRDLLRFMDVITAYDNKVNEVLVGTIGEQMRERLPPFSLADNAENMAEVYLSKLKIQVNQWVDNIAQATKLGGDARVETRLDGRLQTTGPTDLFNLLNESLSLARVAGVRRLQASVVNLCASSLSEYLFVVVNDLVDDYFKSNSLRYTCALANDCWQVLDRLDQIEEEQSSVISEWNVSFDPLREQCSHSAQRCLEVIAQMVRSDLKNVMSKLFTESHLESKRDEEDVAAVVVATLDDYFEDLALILELPFVSRCAKLCLRDVTGDYLARMAHAYAAEGMVRLGKKELQLIMLDRDRIVMLLNTRFARFGGGTSKLFTVELNAWNDVVELLSIAPALIPATAVTIASRDDRFRQHVLQTAKMCVDLVCNVDATKSSERLAKEVKTMCTVEMDNRVPVKSLEASGSDLDAMLLELEKQPYARMWPMIKFPGAPTGTQQMSANKRAREAALRELERYREAVALSTTTVKVNSTSEQVNREKTLRAKQSESQWVPPTKPVSAAATPAPVVATTPTTETRANSSLPASTPPKNPLVYEPQYWLTYREVSPKGAILSNTPCLCALVAVSEGTSDIAFVRLAPGASKGNKNGAVGQGLSVAFRALVTDIVRVEYWDSLSGPGHFGPDGLRKQDPPMTSGRTANKDVEFAVAVKKGDRVHLTASTPEEAATFVAALHAAVKDAYAKWGSTFKDKIENLSEKDLAKKSVSELRALAMERGLDVSRAIEKSDFVKTLRGSAASVVAPDPPAPTANPFAAPAPSSSGAKSSTAPAPSANPFAAPAPSSSSGANPFAAPALPPSKPASLPPPTKPSSSAPAEPPSSSAAAAPSKPVYTPPAAPPKTVFTPPAPPAAAASTKSAPPPVPPKTVVPPPATSAISTLPPIADLAPEEMAMIELQTEIRQGLLLIEDGDAREASRLFGRAVERATALGNVKLKAQATAGLAASYRDTEGMELMAGPMFERAAGFFASINETSDRIDTLSEAANMYVRVGQSDQAVRCLERYDNIAKRTGNPQVFAQRIQEIKSTHNSSTVVCPGGVWADPPSTPGRRLLDACEEET